MFKYAPIWCKRTTSWAVYTQHLLAAAHSAVTRWQHSRAATAAAHDSPSGPPSVLYLCSRIAPFFRSAEGIP